LGKPACLVLSALRRVGLFLTGGERVPSGPPKKILLIKMTEQGATVLAYRAITRAIEMVGRENVYSSGSSRRTGRSSISWGCCRRRT
jgi:hypothetical protein